MQRPIIQKGTILIARPTLLADVFHRSVVLITEHTDDGTIGFVLNKSLDIPVNQFLKEINSNELVFEGGPVDLENIYYLHTRPDLIMDSVKVINGLYWSGNYKNVAYSINNGFINHSEIRFYLGYSGWAKHQLEDEITNNAWNVINDINFDVFQDWDSNLWRKQMQNLGGENLLWYNMPENPALN